MGANGFVGSAISRQLSLIPDCDYEPILKGDNFEKRVREVDFVIHAANSAKRFSANSKPDLDRHETLGKTKEFLRASRAKPFLLISSISCRTQLDTPYGINRRDCEIAVLEHGGSVVRLGPMFGKARTRDVVHDICENRTVFADRSSKQSFSNVDWNASFIARNFSRVRGIIEIGSRNTITLGELADYAESKSEFSGRSDDQYPLFFDTGPDVSEVFKFIDQLVAARDSH